MPATILDHVTPRMRIYHEETFGPVKCIVRVKDTQEAIACANDNEYGLSAAVFGRDIARAFNVARESEVLLYDWWPLVEERRVYERLYEAPIEVRPEPDAASATSA